MTTETTEATTQNNDSPENINTEAQEEAADTESCGSSCSSCNVSGCGERSEPVKLSAHPKASIKHVIAVVSGKGGVGKSLITSQLAVQAQAKGFKVGVLDADITGPSMARAFGISEHVGACEDGIIPQETSKGTKVVSTNMLLPDETTPVLWRGAIITNLITQFFSEVLWGDLDYLFIDMPPGTGDVALTVFQSLPIEGIVIVTAPQDLVSMIVGKAINMAQMMDVPVLGIIENMAFYQCPDCKSTHQIFGKSSIGELAKEYGIGNFASLPINPSVAELMDKGEAENIKIPELSDIVDKLITA